MAVGGSFRYTVWDPWMILSQMATLQCYFYAALGAWVFTWDLLAGQYPRSLDQAGHFVALFAEKFLNKFRFKTSPKERAKVPLAQKVFKYSSLMLNQPHGKILVAAYLCNALSWSVYMLFFRSHL